MQGEKALERWMEYLNSIDWKVFLRECDEIENATETFLELQELKILKGFITRIHSFEEGIEKSVFIREKGLKVPIFYVLPEQPKSNVYLPNSHTILLEDQIGNALDWEQKGGKSILFNPNSELENKRLIKKINHLLLK